MTELTRRRVEARLATTGVMRVAKSRRIDLTDSIDLMVTSWRRNPDLVMVMSDISLLVSAAIDPRIELSQSQVDAFLTASVNTSITHTSWFSDEYGVKMNAFIRHCIKRWGATPEADAIQHAGRLTMKVAAYANGIQKRADYCHTALASMVETVPDIDTLEAALRETGRCNGQQRPMARIAYSAITGVPLQWVDDNIVDGFIEGSDPENRWRSATVQERHSLDIMMSALEHHKPMRVWLRRMTSRL